MWNMGRLLEMRVSGTGVEHMEHGKAAGDEREWNRSGTQEGCWRLEGVEQEWNMGRLLEMRESGTGVEHVKHGKSAGDEMYT